MVKCGEKTIEMCKNSKIDRRYKWLAIYAIANYRYSIPNIEARAKIEITKS